MYLCRRCFTKYRKHVKKVGYVSSIVACDVCGRLAEFHVDDGVLEVLYRAGGVKAT